MDDEKPFVPSGLMANDIRRIADQLEALNLNIVTLVEMKREESDFQKKGYHGARKDPKVWIACRAEVRRLLDTCPFVDWTAAKENPVFRDATSGNMYREFQWRRFLDHHVIPNKPDDGSGVDIVALGKADKEGPPACARKDSLHCAKSAFDWAGSVDNRPWEWDSYRVVNNCRFCQKMQEKQSKLYEEARMDRLMREVSARGT